MALLSEIQKPTSLPPPPKRFKHHVLFSYAGEDEEYVNAVHAALPAEVNVFNYRKTGIWGRELAKELEHLYRNEAPFCVVFLSKAYLESEWTEKELGIVSRVAKRKPGYMLPVVLDGTVVPEIEHIAWLDKSLAPEQLAGRIVAKIQEPPPKPWWFYLSLEAKVAIAAVLLALIVFGRQGVNYFRPSRTEVTNVQATEAITATVVNRGPKRATIVGQRLKFGALPLEDTVLRLDKPAAATIVPGKQDVKLVAYELLPKCDADGIRPKKDKVLPLLEQQPVTLEIDIRESDDAPGQSTRRSVAFPAARLKPFVERWVSDYESSDCD